MKKRIIYVAILTAMISSTLMSGCKNTEVTPKVTEPVTTTSAVETTVAPTTQATVTTVAPTTENETTVAETDVATEPQDTEAQTEEPKIETEKTETNKPSSNTNSGGNTTSSQKPAQDTNNKPSNNTSQTVTDDTKLNHEQFSTAANMHRVVTSLNSYYIGKGMTLNTSLTTDNSGWMFAYQGELNTTANRSYNEQYNRIVTGLDEQIDAFLEMSEATYSDLTFNCYAQMQSTEEYHIYFCHE